MNRKISKKILTIALTILVIASYFSLFIFAADAAVFSNSRTSWQIPQSQIILPNRRLSDAERSEWITEYWAMGGAFAFEMEVIRLINEVRASHGLHQVRPDYSLMLAARFYAQLQGNLNTEIGHNQGPYRVSGATHGASANIARAFGGRLRWNAGNSAGGQRTPQELVYGRGDGSGGWMNSPGHAAYILSPEHRFIGAGTHVGGGRFSLYHYMFMSDNASPARNEVAIENATGGGRFAAGEVVSIRATPVEGYRFAGWEGLDSEDESTTFIMPANAVTIRANFEPIQYTITFDANGGNNAPDEQIKNHGTDLALSSIEPAKHRYTFLGWATSDTSTIAEYEPEDYFARNNDTTLYAVWEPVAAIAIGQFSNQSGSPEEEEIVASEWRIFDDGVLEVDEGFINWLSSISPWDEYKDEITSIVFTGPITAGTSIRNLFYGLSNVERIEGLTYFDTSQTTNMSAMFYGMSSLQELDVSSFNTENVTGMSFMFAKTESLESLDVSGFNTGRVVNMMQMFSTMSSLESLDLSSFNTADVTNMDDKFLETGLLRELTLGEQLQFIGMPNLPEMGYIDDYEGRWKNEELVFTSARLMSNFDGATMAGSFVWQPIYDDCVVIAEGHFENQLASDNNMQDSSWVLCDNGILEINEGYDDWAQSSIYSESPWHNYESEVTHIVFADPVEAGKYPINLFRDLPNLVEVENLTAQIEMQKVDE